MRALEAFELARTMGNVNFPDAIDQLALVAAERSDIKTTTRLAALRQYTPIGIESIATESPSRSETG